MDGDDLGKVMPGFHEGEETRIWRVPIVAYMMPGAKKLKVVNMYTFEGILCIDVEEPQEST